MIVLVAVSPGLAFCRQTCLLILITEVLVVVALEEVCVRMIEPIHVLCDCTVFACALDDCGVATNTVAAALRAEFDDVSNHFAFMLSAPFLMLAHVVGQDGCALVVTGDGGFKLTVEVGAATFMAVARAGLLVRFAVVAFQATVSRLDFDPEPSLPGTLISTNVRACTPLHPGANAIDWLRGGSRSGGGSGGSGRVRGWEGCGVVCGVSCGSGSGVCSGRWCWISGGHWGRVGSGHRSGIRSWVCSWLGGGVRSGGSCWIGGGVSSWLGCRIWCGVRSGGWRGIRSGHFGDSRAGVGLVRCPAPGRAPVSSLAGAIPLVATV